MEQGDNHNEVLQFIHDHHIMWQGTEANYSVMGSLSMDVSSLRVSLHIEKEGLRKQRIKLDLYDYEQIKRHVIHLSEEEGFVFDTLESDLIQLTELLEQHRNTILKESYQIERSLIEKRLPLEREKEIIELLKDENLLEYISEQLSSIGIAGEVDNRLLLFILGTSYKHQPLHAVIQSSSGSGKSHLINTIADCFPDEDVLSLSRITSKSLYHIKGDSLKNKLVLIQDFDGLDDEALFAFRELQSFGKLTTSITGKDPFGNHSAKFHTVTGHFASMGATTKELYLDNQSRSILLHMDESKEQTERVLSYIPPLLSDIEKVQNDLKNMIRMLKPHTVINPFSKSLILPHHISMARRLNAQLKQFIEQITFLHQYQRELDEQGRLITTKQDVEFGISLFMECLWLKVDELAPSTRAFYEQLKSYWSEHNAEEPLSLTQREIRHRFGISKTGLQRHIKSLLELEYLAIVSGTMNKGYRYALQYIDNTKELKDELMKGLTG